ncbi:MAG: S8 family serine peptidase [Muribaculaceae bacterium]|nr:S8 family serine peptidase [Muribaculaceae bacterium]
MQKIISRFLLLLVIAFTCGIANAETLTPKKGVVRIKLQESAARSVGIAPRAKANGMLSTGVSTLDLAAQRVKATSIRRVFPYAPEFEAQMAEYGLDRWYEVTFDETVNPLEAQLIFSQAAGVQVANCKVPMVLKDNDNYTVVNTHSTAVRPSKMPFNDPRLAQQWHYNNTGSVAQSRVGADINLFEAWKTNTGTKNTIVAIIDGGIDYTHEDLADNVMLNEAELNGKTGADDDGNGYIDDVYGWNFCTNTKDVYPHAHGTHVAGTVGAVNNNGIGVCGVAGGNGTKGSGVSLLSVQVFDSRSGSGEGDFAAAIVYAANCGASIANCSWGWGSEDYYEQDVMDAIDYFIGTKNSKRKNLMGGVMFFATGNDGATGNFYPSCYEKVVAVGSMTNDFTMASYSNYGTWVDIAAPGGLLDYGDYGGILSTLPGNQYGFNEGTSMATPHVTGIAALVTSAHGNANIPAETIRQQILTSVNDLYSYNPGADGQHGLGYVDAAKAMLMGDGTAPSSVESITAFPAQDNVTLKWVVPASSDNNVNYHMVYYSTEAFTAESDLSTIASVAVDTKFNESGDTITFELNGLSPLTTYYIAIKAVNRWGDASELSPVITATTNAGPKMTIDKTSLSFTVKPGAIGEATFNIGNDDEGLLKWSASVATTQATIATRSASKPAPGIVGSYNSKVGITPYAANQVFRTSDFIADEYPKNFKYYDIIHASIGDEDNSLPNSMAQWFYVDPNTYPNGFNLTAVSATSFYGANPTVQIFKGNSISNSTLLQEFEPAFYSDGAMKLNEQVNFAPGESFWVVFHFPGGQQGYPLGMATVANEAHAAYSYMSNDMGKTWVTLAQALKGSPYESMSNKAGWAITAISQNPAWNKIITLTPAEGQVVSGGKQPVTISTDGQPIVNGTYKFNLSFNTNESEPFASVIPVTMTVSGNAPVMSPARVVDFGKLLVGENKTITVEVFNEGYGLFGSYGSLSGSNIVSTSEHFVTQTYIAGGFPARSHKTFDVTFEPKAAGSHTGAIVFKHSDGTEFKVTVTGVATDPAKIAFEPDTIKCDTLDVNAEAVVKEFSIKNEGNYPLEFVFPKFSDRQLENQGKAAHRFGYVTATNLNGATDFEYDGNPALLGGVDITSSFDDNTYLSRQIAIGFEFPFYGKNYENLYITSYGGLAFGVGESPYRSPLSESSYGLEGVPYISAYGYQLAMGPNSKIEYAKQDGKFVVKFTDVLGLVYDQEYTPISFHIALSSNGDIEIFYDSYDPLAMSLFQDGSTLYCGILDHNGTDALTVTSADIADYWASSDDPAGYVYQQFTNQSSVKFIAPKPNFVASLTPAYGIVNPGESVNITTTVKTDESMVAGQTYNNLVVMSNDPQKGTSFVRFEAIVAGSQLLPKSEVDINTLDFGKVFRTSVAQKAITVKNVGKDSLSVNNATVGADKFKVETTFPFVLAPGASKDVIVTMPTVTEGVVSDNISIFTQTDEHKVAITGEVIGCPSADLSYEEIDTVLLSSTPLAKPLTITNNGNEALVYSITPNPEYISFSDLNDNAKVAYSYAASIDDSSVTFEWIDIETTGLGEQNNFTYYNNHDYAEVKLPFEFPFYGKKYNTMYIYNTGFVSFTKRNDDHIWPEPPAEFPAGTVYTNIIAPYWGLHTMDQSKTAGTYHYLTDDQAIISWMEYGNSMNLGVCYQLIMKKDGSFKFQYKGFGEYADIYGVFGLAGLSNENGTEGFRIPERYVVFNNAVQFFPVVENTIAPESSRTIDITVNTNKLAGQYNSNITLNTNVPGRETIEIPINLTLTGEAKPVFPTDSIIVERVVGHFDAPTAGPITAMGANYEACFYVKNEGSAPFTITHIKNGGPSWYDDWFEQYYPIFSTFYEAEEIDWITGEPTGNKSWGQYYDYTPIVVGKSPQGISVPMMYDYATQVGTYDVPLTFYYNENDSAVVNIRFIVTPAPVVTLDKEEIRVSNVTPQYVGTDSVCISNTGEYKLTYELTLDPTGQGYVVEEDDNGGIAPASVKAAAQLSAQAVEELSKNMVKTIKPFESKSAFDVPKNFTYRNALYYPSLTGSNTTYQYGAGNTFGQYKAATHYVSPADGFNISHIYIATTLTNSNGSKISNVDVKVEIINGEDYENGQVLGSGSYHIDQMKNADYIIIPLDRAVYMSAGQNFYVVVTYPVGVEYPAYICLKEESVVSNRYMGWVEGYGWFDMATMFKDQVGSCGYIMTCLETVEGSGWVRMLNADDEKAGTIAPGQSLNVKFELNSVNAPVDKGNKAMLIIKSNDPMQPYINFPIYLDKNSAPVISTPTELILAQEGSLTTVNTTVIDTEGDDFTVRLDDAGKMSVIASVTAVGGEATITANEDGSYKVSGANAGVNVAVAITPAFESAGDYNFTLTATDSLNNESQAQVRYTVIHTNRAPIAAEIAPITIMQSQTSDIISFADYFTDPDGDDLSYSLKYSVDGIVSTFISGNNAIFAGDKVGKVYVSITATDPTGASATALLEINVTEYSGIEGVSINAKVGVYPNPVVETLYVTCDFDCENATYSIYGENGALLYNESAQVAAGSPKAINVANLPAGVYILKVVANEGVATYPVIKK